MNSSYTQAALDQMKKAGKDRTSTTTTTQEQAVPPIDIGQLAMVLAMLLGKSKPAGEMIGEISDPGAGMPVLPGMGGLQGLNLTPPTASPYNAMMNAPFNEPANFAAMTPMDVLQYMPNINW